MTALRRLEDRPTWLLGRANGRAHRILGDAFAAEGVRGYHYRVLAALDQYGALSQADLGRYSGIDKSDVVATLNELVDLGLAARAPDAVDRRRNTVSLTRRGAAKLLALDAALDDVQAAVLEPLEPDERTALVHLLTKLTGTDTSD